MRDRLVSTLSRVQYKAEANGELARETVDARGSYPEEGDVAATYSGKLLTSPPLALLSFSSSFRSSMARANAESCDGHLPLVVCVLLFADG